MQIDSDIQVQVQVLVQVHEQVQVHVHAQTQVRLQATSLHDSHRLEAWSSELSFGSMNIESGVCDLPPDDGSNKK